MSYFSARVGAEAALRPSLNPLVQAPFSLLDDMARIVSEALTRVDCAWVREVRDGNCDLWEGAEEFAERHQTMDDVVK